MAETHFVCKSCSSPGDGQVVCFGVKENLDFHLAEKHGGKVDPWMVLNLQSQSRSVPRRRGERDRDGAQENTENIEPLPVPPQNFNMDAAQFPTLGNDATESSDNQTSTSTKVVGGKGKVADSPVAVSKQPSVAPLRFTAPKMTENEFPSLGGGDPKKAPTLTTTWASGPNLSANVPEPKKTIAQKVV